MMSEDSLTIERIYKHPVERVFSAFSSRTAIAAWLSPAPDILIDVLEFNFVPEGRYRYQYRLPDGLEAELTGQFIAIHAPNRLSFSWKWLPPDPHADVDSLVTVVIEPIHGGSRLTVHHEKLSASGMSERHSEGWNGALNRLEIYINGNATGN